MTVQNAARDEAADSGGAADYGSSTASGTPSDRDPPTGILAIDVGNLVTSLALWHATEAPHHWRMSSSSHRPKDEYRLLLSALLERDGLAPSAVTGAVVACVVPTLAETIASACRDLFGLSPLVVGPGVRTGLRISTEQPREVGPDRIANAVAAIARFGAPAMVLDFTTALIIDVVGPAGDYSGAIIAPGMGVASDALARRTAQLRRIELRPPPRAIAANTEQSLQSGLVFGYVGLVEGLIRRARSEVGPAPVVATGEAPWIPDILRLTDVVDAYDPLLTLDGLRRIYIRHHRAG